MELTCNTCQESKPEEQFAFHDVAKTRRRRHCRSCGNARDRARYALPEVVAATAVRHLDYRQRKPEQGGISRRRWRRENPTQFRLGQRNNQQLRRARLRDVPSEPIDYRTVFSRGGGTCGICGGSVTYDTGSVDHIQPLARGGWHTYDNVQLAHLTCNVRKGTRVALLADDRGRAASTAV